MGQPVAHFEIMGTAGRLQAFYSQLSGWEITKADAQGEVRDRTRESKLGARAWRCHVAV